MILHTKTAVLSQKGEPYKSGENDLTIGEVIGNILVVQKSTDPWKQYLITNKITQEECDIKTEDITFIKKILEDHAKGERSLYYPYVIGQIIDILENGKSNKDATK